MIMTQVGKFTHSEFMQTEAEEMRRSDIIGICICPKCTAVEFSKSLGLQRYYLLICVRWPLHLVT